MKQNIEIGSKTATPGRALYSVIRYVPSILREEFVNVGVVVVSLGSHDHGLKSVSSFGDHSRVRALPGSDGPFVRHALYALGETLSRQSKAVWTEERFSDFVVAYSANNLQLSPPCLIETENAQSTLAWLFADLVEDLKVERRRSRAGRSVIRDEVKSVFASRGLFKLGLEENYTLPVRSEPVVDMAYQNGVWHCYQAVAFDVEKRLASQQVNAYRQTITDARLSDQRALAEGKFAVFTNENGDPELRSDLLGLLQEQGAEVLRVAQAAAVAGKIERDLRAHDLVHPSPGLRA